MTRIVLASGSPRRSELLGQLRVTFDVLPADIDETPLAGEDPVRYVRRLSVEKAAAADRLLAARGGGAAPHVARRPSKDSPPVVIAADTTVDLDGEILGKPADRDEALHMLRRLSARTHRVHTGLTVARGADVATDVATTHVTFAPVSPRAAEWYVATGEPFDKAGAYGLQGAGGVFVASVRGSVSNVVGLPLTTLVVLARRVGVDLTS